MKKFLSAIMASAMILALAVPALATAGTVEQDSETQGATVTINGTVQAEALSITYGTAGAVTLNPYRETVSSKTDSVIGTTSTVSNNCKVPVIGSIKAKATPEGGIVLLGGPVNSESIAKEAFLFIDVYGARNEKSDGDVFAAYSDFDGTAFTDAENRIILGEGDNEKVDRFYLEDKNSTNKTLTYVVMGNTAEKCSTWNATDDKVTVEVVFSWKRTALTIST